MELQKEFETACHTFFFGKGILNLPDDVITELINYDSEPKDYTKYCKNSGCGHKPVDFVFEKEMGTYGCPKSIFQIGWYIYGICLTSTQQTIFGKFFNYENNDLFSHPQTDIKWSLKTIEKVLIRDFLELEPEEYKFRRFMTPDLRIEIGKDIKSVFGLDLKGCDGIFLLQAAAIYLYVEQITDMDFCAESCLKSKLYPDGNPKFAFDDCQGYHEEEEVKFSKPRILKRKREFEE